MDTASFQNKLVEHFDLEVLVLDYISNYLSFFFFQVQKTTLTVSHLDIILFLFCRVNPNGSSRVCKKFLYGSFKEVCKKYGRDDLLSADTYAKAKKMATDFQSAKKAVMTKFRKSGFSRWVEKPVEEGMFS